MNLEDIRSLNGKTVLVKPARPSDPNSVALRGTIRVYDQPANQGHLVAEIVLSYPERSDMASREAHEEVIPLSQLDVIKLIDSDVTGTGTYEIVMSDRARTVE